MAKTKKQEVKEDTTAEPLGPEASPKPPRKGGRKKNTTYLPFEEAREFVRGEMIPSRGKYLEWYDRNNPKVVPRFPYRVYTEEWVSWNDFLGNNNKFNEKIGTKWRDLNEAVLWVHSLRLGGFQEWLAYCRDNDLPADIPARPELIYKDWKSWNHWLGNKPVEAIQARQEAQRSQVYYIIHELDVPQNVMTFGIDPMGIAGLKARWEREKFDVVKMFWFDPARQAVIHQIIESLSTPYMDQDRQRIVPNVYEIVWHLSMQLETVVIT